jgi:hypothetical protein
VENIPAGIQATPLDFGLVKIGQLAVLALFAWFAIPARTKKKRKTKDSDIFIDSEEANS